MANRFATSPAGMYALITLMCIAGFIIIPTVIFIILFYYRKHSETKILMFKTGFLYLLLTIIFCINYCGRLYQECFGNFSKDYIFSITTSAAYGMHFLTLIYLSFNRLYFIFNGTIESISRTLIVLFVSICAFAVLDTMLFMLFVYMQHEALIFTTFTIGVLTAISISIWITLLYVYKLFQIVKRDEFDPKTSTILQSLIKYLNLSIIWILISGIFWCIPYSASRLNYRLYLVLYHGLMLCDVSSRTVTFFFSYQFTHKAYKKMCLCGHHLIGKILITLVHNAKLKIAIERDIEENIQHFTQSFDRNVTDCEVHRRSTIKNRQNLTQPKKKLNLKNTLSHLHIISNKQNKSAIELPTQSTNQKRPPLSLPMTNSLPTPITPSLTLQNQANDIYSLPYKPKKQKNPYKFAMKMESLTKKPSNHQSYSNSKKKRKNDEMSQSLRKNDSMRGHMGVTVSEGDEVIVLSDYEEFNNDAIIELNEENSNDTSKDVVMKK